MITNTDSRTNIQEISDGIYRINTPVKLPGGEQFNFNQYLIDDDDSLLFHTGPRKLFPLVRDAIARVTTVEKLRYVALSHFEADECGSLNDFLAVAPGSEPVCGRVAAMVSISDFSDRLPRALADGEELALGAHTVRWFDTPHTPHGWDCVMLRGTGIGTTNTVVSNNYFYSNYGNAVYFWQNRGVLTEETK